MSDTDAPITDEGYGLLVESVAFAIYMSIEADVVTPSLRSWDQAHPFLRNQRRQEAKALIRQLADMELVVSTTDGFIQ